MRNKLITGNIYITIQNTYKKSDTPSTKLLIGFAEWVSCFLLPTPYSLLPTPYSLLIK